VQSLTGGSAEKRVSAFNLRPDEKARESAVETVADRSGEIPEPMVACERAANRKNGFAESPDGRRFPP